MRLLMLHIWILKLFELLVRSLLLLVSHFLLWILYINLVDIRASNRLIIIELIRLHNGHFGLLHLRNIVRNHLFHVICALIKL